MNCSMHSNNQVVVLSPARSGWTAYEIHNLGLPMVFTTYNNNQIQRELDTPKDLANQKEHFEGRVIV